MAHPKIHHSVGNVRYLHVSEVPGTSTEEQAPLPQTTPDPLSEALSNKKYMKAAVGFMAAVALVGVCVDRFATGIPSNRITCSDAQQTLRYGVEALHPGDITASHAVRHDIEGMENATDQDIQQIPVTAPDGRKGTFGSFGERGPFPGSSIPVSCDIG